MTNIGLGDKVYTNGAGIGTVVHLFRGETIDPMTGGYVRRAFVRLESGVRCQYNLADLRRVGDPAPSRRPLPRATRYLPGE